MNPSPRDRRASLIHTRRSPRNSLTRVIRKYRNPSFILNEMVSRCFMCHHHELFASTYCQCYRTKDRRVMESRHFLEVIVLIALLGIS